MGKWVEMTLSGSAGDLASVSLDTLLAKESGGTEIGSFTAGSLLVGDSSNSLRELAIGSNDLVLKVDTSNTTTKLTYGEDASGGVSTVGTSNSNLLSVANGTTAAELTIETAAVADSGVKLATGDQIYDFVIAQGYTSNAGTVTDVTATADGLQGSLTFVDTGTTTKTITLGGSISGLTKDQVAASDRRVKVGAQFYNLGVTTGTSLTGMTGLGLTAGSKTLFDGVGANTLSIGGAGNVKFAGNLTVEGTASFENSDNLRIKDKVFTVGDGSDNNTGGIFIQQLEPVAGAVVGEFFGYKYGAGSAGRFGFVKNTNVAQIENGTAVPDGSATKPWAAVVEVNSEGAVPSGDPAYGGSSAGQGNLYVDTSGTGKAYVYI